MSNIYNDYYKSFIEKIEKRKGDLPNDFEIPTHYNKKFYLGCKKTYSRYYVEYTSKGYGGDYKGFIVGIYLDCEDYITMINKLKQIDNIPSNLNFLDTGKVGRIFFRLEGSIKSEDNWSEYIKWQIDNLIGIIGDIPPSMLEECKKNKSLTNIEADISYGEQKGTNKMIKQPLNQILYGPPGTGKTYKTVNKALEIIFNQDNTCDRQPENKNKKFKVHKKNNDDKCKMVEQEISYDEALNNNDREALKQIFDYYKEQGQIEFITFHQSYGYEEFIEGIKPCDLDDCESEKSDIKYSVHSGIFKKLCGTAQKSNNFDEVYRIFLNDLNEENTVDLQTLKQKKKFQIFKNSSTSIIVKPYTEKATEMLITKSMIEEYMTNEVIIDWKPYVVPICNYIKNKYNFNYSENSNKNYILIIDEINRGNISKIFGELITLIEPSKRIGEDEEIRLTLPNSPDDKFGVPSNLYIIGTMNTADRSIAQIDTALRRRFEFVEMMPKPELLENITIENTDINVAEILTAINERIEYILDREHTIGHSYFIPLIDNPTKTKLDEIFRVNIIPLLAEYFYGDWGDIKIVLNDMKDDGYFIKKSTTSTYYIADNRDNNPVYSVIDKKDGFSIDGYKNIYQPIKKADAQNDTESNGD